MPASPNRRRNSKDRSRVAFVPILEASSSIDVHSAFGSRIRTPQVRACVLTAQRRATCGEGGAYRVLPASARARLTGAGPAHGFFQPPSLVLRPAPPALVRDATGHSAASRCHCRC